MSLRVQGPCVLLSVYDMPAAVRFYTELLGFELLSRSPAYEVLGGVEHSHWCMLGSGSDRLLLNTEFDTGERPPGRPAFAEQPFGTWLFFDCADLDEAKRSLEAAGVSSDGPKAVIYGEEFAFRALVLRDPDGHGITLQHPVAQ